MRLNAVYKNKEDDYGEIGNNLLKFASASNCKAHDYDH